MKSYLNFFVFVHIPQRHPRLFSFVMCVWFGSLYNLKNLSKNKNSRTRKRKQKYM